MIIVVVGMTVGPMHTVFAVHFFGRIEVVSLIRKIEHQFLSRICSCSSKIARRLVAEPRDDEARFVWFFWLIVACSRCCKRVLSSARDDDLPNQNLRATDRRRQRRRWRRDDGGVSRFFPNAAVRQNRSKQRARFALQPHRRCHKRAVAHCRRAEKCIDCGPKLADSRRSFACTRQRAAAAHLCAALKTRF